MVGSIFYVPILEEQTTETHLLWKREVVGTFDEFAGVTVDHGTVYTVGKTMSRAPVSALDAETGDIIWQRPVGSCDSTPLVTEKKVFVINSMWNDFDIAQMKQPVNEERMWCLSADDGEVIWSNDNVFPDGGDVLPIPSEDLVFALSSDDIYSDNPVSKVYAFELKSGEKIWESNYAGAAMGISRYKDKLIVSGTGSISAYGLENGTLIWTNKQVKSWDSNPVIQDESVFVGGGGHNQPVTLFAVNPDNGSIFWSWEDENNPGYALTTPTISGEMVFFGGYSKLYCVNLNSHEIVWTVEGCGNGPYSTPVIQDDVVYFGTTTYGAGNPDYVYAAETDDGDLIWEYKIETTKRLQGIFSQPTIEGDKLYLTADDGYLRCFSIEELN